jgi:hypothetical protein
VQRRQQRGLRHQRQQVFDALVGLGQPLHFFAQACQLPGDGLAVRQAAG